MPVPGIGDLIGDAEKKSRGAIVPIEIGDETGFTAGSMQRLTGTPPRRGGTVPAIGESAARRAAHSGATRCARRPRPARATRLPLEGVRVIDFSMGWAGPICTRTLADLGADVIKIEAIQYPDWWRGVDRRPAYVLEQMYEKSVRYCIMNRNKRGITLDLTRPQGLQLAKRLLADADLAVDNYSVEVLPKLGLGYEVLRKLNPKLVMMSMSAFGAGSVAPRLPRLWLDAGAGLGPAERGRRCQGAAGHEPHRVRRRRRRIERLRRGPDRADPCEADRRGPVHRPRADRMHDAVRRALDRGAFDRRQAARKVRQPSSGFRAARLLSAAPATTTGSWSPFPAMRCGQSSANCWAAPDWAADEALKSAAGAAPDRERDRGGHRAWTSTRAPDEAMNALQAAGVASGVARLPIDLLKDPQLHARGFIQEIDRAFIGRHPQPSMPFRETDQPFAIRCAPPTLGEHNREILAGMLGLSDAEIDQLARDGIIGTEMLMEEQLVKEKKRAAG